MLKSHALAKRLVATYRSVVRRNDLSSKFVVCGGGARHTHDSAADDNSSSRPGAAVDPGPGDGRRAGQTDAASAASSTSSTGSSGPAVAAGTSPSSGHAGNGKSERMQGKLEKLRRRKQRQQQVESSSSQIKNKQTKAWKPKEVIRYDIPTMPGEKKDTSSPLPASYSPTYVEAAWYDWWDEMGFFKPENARCEDAESRRPYVTCLPPPNVTGTLHLGHTLMVAIEDSLVRWHRMCGRPTLWVPGCDHAGIATQIMVEKSLQQSQQKTRHDLGREAFTREVWRWKEEKGDKIYSQLKTLGASLDWQRSKFTMDEDYARAVREAFIRLHDSGTIYRSTQLVNWSCSLKSVISDIEVEFKSIDKRELLPVPGYANKVEFGTMILFAYPVHNSDEKVTVATTRLETMLGDVALAVHPDDTRYLHLIGQCVDHPFTGRSLPIVADASVERELGTGVVKITPAHDFRDYDLGQRHGLPSVTVIDDTGRMTEQCRQFQGMGRFEARQAVCDALKEKGLYLETREHPMDIPLCRRSKDVVEPLLKTQWFVATDQMGQDAVTAVEDGDLRILPEVHKKTWYSWLNNIRDWCISRQLWWGHRIPVYQVSSRDVDVQQQLDDCWVSAHSEQEAITKAAQKYNVAASSITVEQDPDVLDTWFSSSIFPFAALGWPDETADLQRYYPNTMLETGHDILFFWVARMVMMGRTLTGALPFTEVYLHSMVRDAHGRKMSKSLGNVVDPLDVIRGSTLEDLQHKLMSGVRLDEPELSIALSGQKSDFPDGIPECGTDALRFALCTYKAQVEDLNLSIEKVKEYRLFCNKIWNAARFTLSKLGEDFTPRDLSQVADDLQPMDRWILSRLSATCETVNQALAQYEFPTATTAVHQFWIQAFCDVYLESVKSVVASADQRSVVAARHTLYHCLHSALRLLSPFMPYLTEELYQRLPRVNGDDCPSICLAAYPRSDMYPPRDEELEQEVEIVTDALHTMRSLQAEYGIKIASAKVQIVAGDVASRQTLERFTGTLQALSRCPNLSVGADAPSYKGCLPGSSDGLVSVYLDLQEADMEAIVNKLTAKRQKLQGQLKSLESAIEKAENARKTSLKNQETKKQRAEKLTLELQRLEVILSHLHGASR